MAGPVELTCACGTVRIEVAGAPIASVECCCNSCREGSGRIEGMAGARPILGPYGQTPYVLWRKDRVRFVAGKDRIRTFRLTPDSKTRRAVATCCNTALFTEFLHAHWLSMYAGLWPDDTRPKLQMRTMASDLTDPSVLPDDVPNARTQAAGFFFRVLGAWIAMGFRIPKVETAGEIDV